MVSKEKSQNSVLINPDFFSYLPVAFALIKIVRDGKGEDHIVYSYVNERFCEWSFRKKEDFIGKEINDVHAENSVSVWLNYLKQIKESGNALKGSRFYAPLNSFIDYIVAPVEENGTYAVMYLNSAIKTEEFEKLRKSKKINDHNLELATKISSSAMDSDSLSLLLSLIGKTIEAERVYFVQLGKNKKIYASYKSSPNISDPLPPSFPPVASLLPYAESTAEPLILDEAKAKSGDPISSSFLEEGVRSHIAFPFINEGRLIACLCADNFPKEKEEEARAILQNCCYFLSYKWSNSLLLSKLRYRSRHDALTGLLNRYGYDEAIESYFSSNPDEPCVLALIDIDDFKNINDFYGHYSGDEALKNLSSDITSFFGEKAICSRYGGDEIALLLKGTNGEQAKGLFASFKALSHSFSYKEQAVETSFSIGYAEFPKQATTHQKLLELADEACYAAKLSGKGLCFAYVDSFANLDKTSMSFSFHSIADNLPSPFFLFGRSGEIYYVNARCLKLFGYPSLMSFSSCCKEGLYAVFNEKEKLDDLLKSSSEEGLLDLTLRNGKRVKMHYSTQKDSPFSLRYAVVLWPEQK